MLAIIMAVLVMSSSIVPMGGTDDHNCYFTGHVYWLDYFDAHARITIYSNDGDTEEYICDLFNSGDEYYIGPIGSRYIRRNITWQVKCELIPNGTPSTPWWPPDQWDTGIGEQPGPDWVFTNIPEPRSLHIANFRFFAIAIGP